MPLISSRSDHPGPPQYSYSLKNLCIRLVFFSEQCKQPCWLNCVPPAVGFRTCCLSPFLEFYPTTIWHGWDLNCCTKPWKVQLNCCDSFLPGCGTKIFVLKISRLSLDPLSQDVGWHQETCRQVGIFFKEGVFAVVGLCISVWNIIFHPPEQRTPDSEVLGSHRMMATVKIKWLIALQVS